MEESTPQTSPHMLQQSLLFFCAIADLSEPTLSPFLIDPTSSWHLPHADSVPFLRNWIQSHF